MGKLVGYRTLILNAILLIGGLLRVKSPELVPDDGTMATFANTVLDLIFSVPGAGVLNAIWAIVAGKTAIPVKVF